MRRRSERQQDFETLKQTLYTAGVSTVKAAKAQEEMFTTTLEALTEAYEAQAVPQLEAPVTNTDNQGDALQLLLERIQVERQKAISQGDYEAYVDAESKLQHIDELRVTRLERQVRELRAQQQLATFSEPIADTLWTEDTLKAQYKNLGAVREALSIKARTWKEAVQILNQS